MRSTHHIVDRFLRVNQGHPLTVWVGMGGGVGMKVVEGVSTTLILGYDHDHPHANVLYRMLTAKITRTCSDHDFHRHASSGANTFKKLRGGVTNEEFTMVKTSHLSWWRRLNWGIIRFIAQKIGRPLTHKFET